MSRFTAILIVLSSLLFSSCLKSETAVRYNGGSISDSELAENAKMELFQLEQQAFEIKQQAAYEILQDILLEKEAKSRKMTVEELLRAEIDAKVAPVPEDQLRQVYEMYKSQIDGSFEKNREMLVNSLMAQQRNQAQQAFLGGLFDKYKVEFVMKEPEAPRVDVDLEDDPSWGPKNAKVTVVEFSDYECPYCRRMQNSVRQLRKEYSDKVHWVFKDFPLEFHRQAMLAHVSAACAEEQGKAVEFHDRIFSAPLNDGKPDLSQEYMVQTAGDLGLNVGKFTTCIADTDGKIHAEIQGDIEYGQKIGVRGTPAIFINGRFISGALPYDKLKEEVDKEL